MPEIDNVESEVPIWPAMIAPVLTVLAARGTLHRKDLFDLSAEEAGLSEQARNERLATGGLRYEQRMGWVLANTMRAGWVDRPSRAMYAVTDLGKTWLATSAHEMSYSEARKAFREFWPQAHGGSAVGEADKAPESEVLEALDPIEQIDDAIQRIHQNVGEQLLDRLRESHPSFFESAVVKVLLAMGYGGADQRGRAIGGTGDGGVDGVIDQDALGLDQIYVQAKRYKAGSNISGETIQAFVGALAGKNASKGVFITTSEFTASARAYVNTIPTRVILIDGKRLIELMIEYGVGVQVRSSYSVVDLDEDFFE
jgi:restriction system protein